MVKVKEDLTGRRFGKLVVVKQTDDYISPSGYKIAMWDCKCDCGKHVKKTKQSLLSVGDKCSCGCDKPKTLSGGGYDLTGQRFGKLLVTKEAPRQNGDDGPMWYCDCDCGTKDVIARGSYLRAGRKLSCGCYNKEMSHKKNMINLTGQKFDMLTVVEEVGTREETSSKSIFWRCVCDCGNETIVSSNALRKGGTGSCGCRNSKNELLIKNHLSSLKVKHGKQYWFEDLRDPETNFPLMFDVSVFYPNGDLAFLIEYDGEQHVYGSRYKTPEENKKAFDKLNLHDAMKDEYCLNNNIPLLRISYKQKEEMLQIIDRELMKRKVVENGTV